MLPLLQRYVLMEIKRGNVQKNFDVSHFIHGVYKVEKPRTLISPIQLLGHININLFFPHLSYVTTDWKMENKIIQFKK